MPRNKKELSFPTDFLYMEDSSGKKCITFGPTISMTSINGDQYIGNNFFTMFYLEDGIEREISREEFDENFTKLEYMYCCKCGAAELAEYKIVSNIKNCYRLVVNAKGGKNIICPNC